MSKQTKDSTDPLLTADMLAQYAYCPRRMHLMYVDGRWGDNIYTDQGRSIHSRTDSEDDCLPAPPTENDDPEPIVARSVMLTDETLGLIAKPDIIEANGPQATPVEIKRGKVPPTPQNSYEPERVQLMTQALLLRANGFICQTGLVYYAGSRRRIAVSMDAEIESRTRQIIHEARILLQQTDPPPPLTDSPKCIGCSLAGICLPDETNLLKRESKSPPDIRRLYPARDDALPLYVQEQGARVGKSAERLTVSKYKSTLGEFLLKDVSQLVLCGNVSISAQCLHLLCDRGIPVVHLSMGHWFYGVTSGIGLRNAYDRAAQFAAAADGGRRLALARAFVRAKTLNQRTFLRRNAGSNVAAPLIEMRRLIGRLETCKDIDELMGIEGTIAALYFGSLRLPLFLAFGHQGTIENAG